MACSIQYWRIPLSGLESVNPSLASGCEKNVELKSSPTPASLAQSTQLWNCSMASALRSTFFPPKSA